MDMIDFYTPQTIIPLVKRIYPAMASGLTHGVDGHYPLGGYSSVEVEKWGGIVSKKRLRRYIKNWNFSPFRDKITVNKIGYDGGGHPNGYDAKFFDLPKDMDKFIVEIANRSDTCGIVRMTKRAIWFKEASDPSELNIDENIMKRIMQKVQSANIGDIYVTDSGGRMVYDGKEWVKIG